MQDPISDMLTSIRNAQAMGISQIRVPFSRLKGKILEVLESEGFIEAFEAVELDNKKNIQISLKYYHGQPVIEKIKRISRPALRVYEPYDNLPLVRGGLGVAIVSTPKGVMTDKHARAQRIGGEILCTVE